MHGQNLGPKDMTGMHGHTLLPWKKELHAWKHDLYAWDTTCVHGAVGGSDLKNISSAAPPRDTIGGLEKNLTGSYQAVG